MLCRNQPVEGDCVPCKFKNLQLNANGGYMICKNINAKLRLQKDSQRSSVEQSDVEQTSSYERKIAYLIRFHLRDILTSDHRHVWFHIETKSLDGIEDRSQILQKIPEEINVVYSFGSLLSYDTFIGHYNSRSLARICVQKYPKAIRLETATHNLTIQLKNIDSHILINHSTSDNSIQVIFMLKSSPVISQVREDVYRDKKQSTEEIPLCSDLLVRFFPAHMAWTFLRDLPIAGYSRTSSGHLFHVNFALFTWQKDHSNLSPMDKPSYASAYDTYSIEMLWSLGYVFRDKYKDDFQLLHGRQQKSFYDLCCAIWRNLKTNHCYRLRDALIDQTLQTRRVTSNEPSQSKEVAFAILTPYRTEYQPMQTTMPHRGFGLYSSENWLLVHIRDHNGIDRIHNLDLSTRVRFRNAMLKGISCNNRLYQYFGSSNSQMRNQAGWFLSLPRGTTMDTARKSLGDFSKIKNVSTYTARVGLYLTTSKSAEIKLVYKGTAKNDKGEPYLKRTSSVFSRFTASVRRLIGISTKESIEFMAIIIADVEQNSFTFTDGCGKISLALARKVAVNIGIHVGDTSDIPSAFQVRIAGCKGMLSIDPDSKPNEFYILVRESMKKFDSDDWTLHIVDHSRPMPLSLNNQVIRLLSDLGNSHGVFESIQTRCIDRKEYWHPPAKSYLNAMDSLDQLVIDDKRKQYKNAKHFLRRNKIPLPVNDARFLFGIADETGLLQPGQCFIQFRDLQNSSRSKQYHVVQGSVIVTKNPCLHPGDVRKLEAVYVEELESCIRDCIVFSVHGSRPSCNEMAGSDLDGDQYWVYWGDELKIEHVIEPLLYPAAKKRTDQRINDELIVDHVLDTFTGSAPGIIANTHMVIADKHPRGTLSKECEECARLFSRAIDACKTGETISLNRINQLKDKFYQTCPTWMMKFDKPPMDPPSTSVNEILYRKAQEAWIHEDNFQDVLRPFADAEVPLDSIAIDLVDANQALEDDHNGRKRKCCVILFCIAIFILIVFLLVGLQSLKKT